MSSPSDICKKDVTEAMEYLLKYGKYDIPSLAGTILRIKCPYDTYIRNTPNSSKVREMLLEKPQKCSICGTKFPATKLTGLQVAHHNNYMFPLSCSKCNNPSNSDWMKVLPNSPAFDMESGDVVYLDKKKYNTRRNTNQTEIIKRLHCTLCSRYIPVTPGNITEHRKCIEHEIGEYYAEVIKNLNMP